jgi:hypothetical protein
MPERQELIIKRLQEEGAKTVEFFRSLHENDFHQQVYITGPKWDARNLLAHFVSAERTFAFYGRDILNGGEGAPEDFVIDEFNETQVGSMKSASAPDLIAQFEEARTNTIHLIQSMSDADFDRVGRHPWFGKVPLGNMIKLIYRHTMIHQRDIKKAIETKQPVPHVDAKPLSS